MAPYRWRCIMSAPAWDSEWALELARKAVYYLAQNYPEGVDGADPYQQAVNEAAAKGDREAYAETLREYMRGGRQAALEVRKGAA
jgi:hypothetical protein